ncbi:AAA family ATPase [Parasutterella secunda]|uniref:ATP-binding protein n=1 Tax=Parasutterella secunda TaxID=626947 RepID=UPI002011ED8A|nr:AAA family ATPase [Parasutterella secunda]
MVTVNLDDFENKALRNPETLHQFVLNRCNDTDTYYIFIDEVQMCKNFYEVLTSFLRHKNLDIYVTGSNAFLLSGELATLLPVIIQKFTYPYYPIPHEQKTA